jgi:hypothetical protein
MTMNATNVTVLLISAVAAVLTGCASVETGVATGVANTGNESASAESQSRCNVQLQTSIASSGSSSSAKSSAKAKQQSQLDRVAAIAALNQLEMRMPAQQRMGDSLLERLVRDCN